MERAAFPAGRRPRWHAPALALIGALLLLGALALGGGGAFLAWSFAGLARWPLRLLALLALYSLPGLALLRLLWPREHALLAPARLALALGFSVALPPLLLLVFWLLHLPWTSAVTWGYVLLSLGIVGWFELKDRRSQSPDASFQPLASSFALIGICIAALLVRLYAVRDLPVGLLGDSYHHTLMAQLLVEHNGLFSSWQPYAPLATFTYHFGFHANVAFVQHLTGISIEQSLLWTGQILNAIVVPLVFALALALGGSRWAGVWSALLVGMVSNLPAYFVNWGRYTQLAGQIVMLVVLVCWINLIATIDDRRPTTDERSVRQRRRWSAVSRLWPQPRLRLMLLTGIATAALILTHYLVTAIAAVLLSSYLLALLLVRRSARAAGALALLALPTTLLALLLVAPWLVNITSSHLASNATGLVSASPGAAAVIVPLSALEAVVPKYADRFILLGASAGLLLALWRRDWRTALLAIWYALLVLLVVPYLVGLPGAGVIDNITGLGTLYLPSALLAGYLLAALQAYSMALLARLQAPRWFGTAVLGAALLLLIAANTGWQTQVVDQQTSLVSQADLSAMEWIRANTPADARFVVNSFPAYGGTLAAGSDAGWWLPLLAGRATTLPPLTYGSEQGERRGYRAGVNALVMKLRGQPLTDSRAIAIDLSRPVALKTLLNNKIDYIYSGAHPYPGPALADHIDTAKLRDSSWFKLVYDRDGVEIFQFLKSGT